MSPPVTLAHYIQFKGEVENRHDADDLLLRPGDVVVVVRGCPRSLVIACPDGCGSVLTINLDDRAGAAWQMYSRGGLLSLYPSVWREAGCRAHFILRRNRIIWCGPSAVNVADYDPQLVTHVRAALDDRFRSVEDIARELGEVPWEVAAAAYQLVSQGEAEKRQDGGQYTFSRSLGDQGQAGRHPGRLARLINWLRRQWTGR